MNKVITLGTGCPSPTHLRYGPSTLLMFEGTNILIDAGSGVTQRLSQSGLKPSEIDCLMITHLHSDHIVDMYQLYISGWHTGRNSTFLVIGPKGLKKFFAGIMSAYQEELDLRKSWEKRPNTKGLDFEIIEIDDELNYSIGKIDVRSIDVNHEPVSPAYGYEFTLGSKKLVYSGDTAYSKNLEEASMFADILIHEVFIDLELDEKRMSIDTLKNVKSYHSSPEEIAKLASAAKVKKLILNHFVPPVFNRNELIKEISTIFDGELFLSEDLMQFEI